MATTHTPGPWECREIPGLNVIAIAPVGMAMPIFSAAHWTSGTETPSITDEDRANARLIATAPKMLAALRAVASCPQAAPWLARLPLGDGNAWDAVLTAIAEATGEARS